MTLNEIVLIVPEIDNIHVFYELGKWGAWIEAKTLKIGSASSGASPEEAIEKAFIPFKEKMHES